MQKLRTDSGHRSCFFILWGCSRTGKSSSPMNFQMRLSTDANTQWCTSGCCYSCFDLRYNVYLIFMSHCSCLFYIKLSRSRVEITRTYQFLTGMVMKIRQITWIHWIHLKQHDDRTRHELRRVWDKKSWQREFPWGLIQPFSHRTQHTCVCVYNPHGNHGLNLTCMIFLWHAITGFRRDQASKTRSFNGWKPLTF